MEQWVPGKMRSGVHWQAKMRDGAVYLSVTAGTRSQVNWKWKKTLVVEIVVMKVAWAVVMAVCGKGQPESG